MWSRSPVVSFNLTDSEVICVFLVESEVSSNFVTDDLLVAVVGGSANWISYPGLVVSKSNFVVGVLFRPSTGSKVCVHSVDEGGAVEVNSPEVVFGRVRDGTIIVGVVSAVYAVAFLSVVGHETQCVWVMV
jgi:hypothetical protein